MFHNLLLVSVLFLGHLHLFVQGKSIRLVSPIEKEAEPTVRILTTCQPGQFIKRDCKFYIECYKGRWRRSFCGRDQFWNSQARKCDDLINVPECYKLYQNITDRIEAPRRALVPMTNTEAPSPSITITSTEAPVVSTSAPTSPATTQVTTSITSTTTSTTNKSIWSGESGETHKKETSTQKSKTSGKDEEEDYEYDEEPESDLDYDKGPSKPQENRSRDMAVDRPTTNEIAEETILTEDDKKMKTFDLDKSVEVSTEKSAILNKSQQNGYSLGKTCIVRGKEMICTDTVTQPSVDLATNTINNSSEADQQTSPGKSRCDRKRAQYLVSINLDMGKTVFDLVRIIAYYVNLTIYSLKST